MFPKLILLVNLLTPILDFHTPTCEISIQATDPNTSDNYNANIVYELIYDYFNSFYKNKYSLKIYKHIGRF